MSNVLLGKHTLPLKNQREIKIDLNLRTSIENIMSNTMIKTKSKRYTKRHRSEMQECKLTSRRNILQCLLTNYLSKPKKLHPCEIPTMHVFDNKEEQNSGHNKQIVT